MAVQRTASAASVHPAAGDTQAPVQEPAVLVPLAAAPIEEPVGVEPDVHEASADPPSADALVDPPAAEPLAAPAGEPLAAPGPPEPAVAHELFDLHETGQIHGDVAQARHTAEAMLYIARVSEAMGLHMGAGALESIEVYGGESAYAAVTTDADGSLSVSGCLSTSGTPPEQLRDWHRTRTQP